MIDENIKELMKRFLKIKSMNYIKSTRKGTTGIGKTFEDLLGKVEDQDSKPDFRDIEIKTKNGHSKAYTTLFNLTPKGKDEYEIKRLRNVYGYPDTVIKNENVLNNSVFGNISTLIGCRFYFRLIVDRKCEKIYLLIWDRRANIFEKNVYWTFNDLKERLITKLSYLAYITGWKTSRNGETYYKYTNIKIYKLKSFEEFINMLEKGKIRVTFHIGVYRDGERIGETHDRGTSFQILEEDLNYLFDEMNLEVH